MDINTTFGKDCLIASIVIPKEEIQDIFIKIVDNRVAGNDIGDVVAGKIADKLNENRDKVHAFVDNTLDTYISEEFLTKTFGEGYVDFLSNVFADKTESGENA